MHNFVDSRRSGRTVRRSVGAALAAAALAVAGTLWTAPASAVFEPATARQFAANGANGVAVAADGSVFLVSAFDNQVRKYDPRGSLLLTIGSFGVSPGQFNLPSALTIGPDGDVYVTDVGGNRVQSFTQSGTFVRVYGSGDTLANPRGVAVDAAGNVYVADADTGLKKFGPTGSFLQSYPAINKGFAVAIAPNGDVLASEYSSSPQMVKRIDPSTGAVLQTISGFGQATDIEIDSSGRVHVLDFNTGIIRTYASNGTFLEASAPIPSALAMALDQYGRMFVSGGSSATTFNPTPVAVSLLLGAAGDRFGDGPFTTATTDQIVQRIDFEADGFDDLAAHTFRPIPPSTYQSQGVTLIGLDARSVGANAWTHSLPIGAWQTGFSQPAQPYSFVFADPVASFGLFGNDVEGDIAVTVHLADGRREFFVWPSGGSADNSRFFGLTTSTNAMSRVDFDSGDYHIVDDVRFGTLPGDTTAPTATIVTPASGAVYDLAAPVSVEFACSDNVGVTSCVGDLADGAALDTSTPGTFGFDATATDAAGLTGVAHSAYTVSSTISGGLGLDGSITSNPAEHPVTITDAPDAADGVVIIVGGTGTTKVSFTVCGGFVVRLAPGSEVTLTCGSVIADVAAGVAEIVTPGGGVTMSVPAGGAAEFEADGSVANLGAVAVTTAAAGVTQVVAPGATAAWRTEGFFAPVDMGGVWNTTKGGSNVPMKFRVFYGSATVRDPATLSTAFVAVRCASGSEDVLEVLDVAGSTTLTYAGDQFHLNWKTPKQPGTCYRVTISSGGTALVSALFKLK